MQLVMLSGNSLKNRDWIYATEERLSHMFVSTYVQNYSHWDNGDSWIDLEHELSVLEEQAQNLQKPYGVFAKSIGTVLAVQAVRRGILKPEFIFFCGVPLSYIIENYSQFASELKACKLPTVLIHNENDVVGSAADLKEYLGEELASNVIVTPGDTHDYEDYHLLKSKLTKLKDTA